VYERYEACTLTFDLLNLKGIANLRLPSLSATQETASLSTPHYRVFAT